MAIQNANFNSSDYVLSSSKRVITCTSSQVTQPKYRFYLEVIYNSKTYAYTFRPNNDGYGLIDISSIINNIVYSTSVQAVKTIPDSTPSGVTNDFQQNIHSIPHNKFTGTGYTPQYLSTSNTGAKKVELKLFDFYAANSNAAPSKQGSATTDNMYLLSGYNQSTDLINFSFTDYTTNTNRLLLNANYNSISSTRNDISVDVTDYGTIAFLNRTTEVNTSSITQYITIKYYNTSGALTDTQVFDQSTTYGGQYNSSGVADDSMIIHFGCYPANLNKLPAAFDRPSDQTDLSYYEVYLSNADGTAAYSKKYRFNIVDRCDKYDTQRLAYINKFGVWEYVTFNKERTDKISNNKTEIKSSIYNYEQSYATVSDGYNEKPFVPGVAHESRKNVATNVKQMFTINTGYLKDYDIEKVRDMFISSKINYINSDGTALAVMLTNKSIDEVVVSHKYEQTEYRLTFEYSIENYNSILF